MEFDLRDRLAPLLTSLRARVAEGARALDAGLLLAAPSPIERHQAARLVLLRSLVLHAARARDLAGPTPAGRRGSAWRRFTDEWRALWAGHSGGVPHHARLFDPRAAPWLAAAPVSDATVERLQALLGTVPIDGTERAVPWEILGAETFGDLSEAITDALVPGARPRKRAGSYQTPRPIAVSIVESAIPEGASDITVCDPAAGAGAFLLAALRRLVPAADPSARRAAADDLYGADVDPLAVALAEAALWLEIGDASLRVCDAVPGLRLGDALLEIDWRREAPLAKRGGFDAVVGNPPWVAFAGRAAQPLSPAVRAAYRSRYAAFRGYPTLHGPFVELGARLAPRGVVALLVPSPIADLDGYRGVRRALTEKHVPREPLVEHGQDAFEGVTQPCIALLADPSPSASPSDRPWRLAERSHASGAAARVDPPAALLRIAERPPWPPELFGEMGFQSAGDVAKTLIKKLARPEAPHVYPLLEGKDVRAFRVGPPRLFLDPNVSALARARCRLRAPDDYRRVAFVVRQTASMPIAALHDGSPFRNSLLAGFTHATLPPELVVGLLNSSLYRALHLAARRDARQAAFPQVKLSHLRSLPAPPRDAGSWRRIRGLVRSATRRGPTPRIESALDVAVYESSVSATTMRARFER